MIPSGTICICANTNLKYQSEDTIVFASESAKRTFFDSKVIKTFTDQMYTRGNTNGVNSTLNGKLYVAPGTSSIKVDCPIGQIYNADYMFYVDNGYSGKTFYNFITDVSYVSDSVTQITFTEDVFMTWQNDISINKTFVERETVSSDTRYDSSFDIPDYVQGDIREYGRIDLGAGDTVPKYICIVLNRFGRIVQSSQGLNDYAVTTVPWKWYGKNQKRVDGFTYIYMRSDMTVTEQDISSAYIDHNMSNPTTDSSYEILGIYTVPQICVPATVSNFLDGRESGGRVAIVTPFVPTNVSSDYTILTASIKVLAYSGGVRSSVYTPPLPSVFNGYLPKNNKLYSSPYVYYILTNNQGVTIKLKPQYFTKNVVSGVVTPIIKFQLIGTNGVFANVDAFPVGYMNDNDVKNNDYRVSLPNYPDVAFEYDKARDYRWNKISSEALRGISSSVLSGISQASKGLDEESKSSPNPIPVVGEALNTVFSVGQDLGTMKWDLPEMHGLDTSGESACSEELMKFSLVSYGIDKQAAEAIDSKFTRYGYAIGKIKSISLGLNGRKRFHYVKTSECNIVGSVPMYAKNYLNERFDNGIRMWSSAYYLTDVEDNPIV